MVGYRVAFLDSEIGLKRSFHAIEGGRAPRGWRVRQRLGAGPTDEPGGSRSRGRAAEALPCAGAAGAHARVCQCRHPQTRGFGKTAPALAASASIQPTRATAGRDGRVSRLQAGSSNSPACDLLVCPSHRPRNRPDAVPSTGMRPRQYCRKPMPHSGNFKKYLGPFTPPKAIRPRTKAGRIKRTNGHLNGESSTYGSRDTPPLTFSVRFSLHHHHIATRPSLDRRHKSCREGPAPPANENGGQGLRCQEPIAQATGPRRIHKTALRELTTGGNPLFFYHRVKTHLLPHEWGPLSSLTGSGSPAGRGRISARQDPRKFNPIQP